jgi:hypothetical protein
MKRRLAALLIALAPACGSNEPAQTSTTSSGTGGQPAAVKLSLPQFVRGAARVDTAAFPSILLVIAAEGASPDLVTVTIGGATFPAVADGGRFVATIDTTSLPAGPQPLTVEARVGEALAGSAQGTLTVASGSLQLTDFAKEGPGYDGTLIHDQAGDALVHTWISVAGGGHGFHLARLDGAFARLQADDVRLDDPADQALGGRVGWGRDTLGVVYRVAKPNDPHWSVKLRVLDRTSFAEKVPAMDLTAGEAAFTVIQAAADPGGHSAAWLHIRPAADPKNPPPVELRYARWDLAAGKLSGPLTLDSDQPIASGSSDGPQILEPLAEIAMACNAQVCLVAWSRDRYDALVDLNVPKLFVAAIDLATAQVSIPAAPVSAADWDTQEFGQQLVALADGTFRLVYTANDTSLAPKSPCDETLERDHFKVVTYDATGKVLVAPRQLFDFEGTRAYPRLGELAGGFAMLWEDQRSECAANGHIRMASGVASLDLKGMVDPYLEWPDSVGLPPEYPTLAVTGSSFVVGWSDNRHGNGLLDPKPELFLDTYWRK